MKQIGQRIRTLREAAGLTQEQLSEGAKIANRALQRIEAGAGNPELGTIQKLASALHVEPWTLLVPLEISKEAHDPVQNMRESEEEKSAGARSEIFKQATIAENIRTGVANESSSSESEAKKEISREAIHTIYSDITEKILSEVRSGFAAQQKEIQALKSQVAHPMSDKQKQLLEITSGIDDGLIDQIIKMVAPLVSENHKRGSGSSR